MRLLTSRSRGRLAALAVAACAVASLALQPTSASAVSLPVATTMTVVLSELDPSVTPDTSGAPAVLVVSGQAFRVTVTTRGDDGSGTVVDLPASYNKSTTVTFSIKAATGKPTLSGTTSVVLPPGVSSVATDSAKVTGGANRAVLTGTVTAGTKEAKAITPGTSAQFDVAATGTVTGKDTSFWSTNGSAAPCAPTSTPGNTVCADLVLPNGSLSNQVLTTGLCDSVVGCGTNKTLVQALVDLGTSYPRSSPATLIVKCDKTVCPGSGISSYDVVVNLAPTGALAPAPACPSKGIVGPDQSYCVDYVQSKRDNAGDTHLYLLFTEDARASMP